MKETTTQLMLCSECHRYKQGENYITLPEWAIHREDMSELLVITGVCPDCMNVAKQFEPLFFLSNRVQDAILVRIGDQLDQDGIRKALEKLREETGRLLNYVAVRPRNLKAALSDWVGGHLPTYSVDKITASLVEELERIFANTPALIPISYDQLKRELMVAAEALRIYGRHQPGCSTSTDHNPEICDCGLNNTRDRFEAIVKEFSNAKK